MTPSANAAPHPMPVFVIGSPRSGTSILTWCIGQHRNITALEETNWIAYLSVGARVAFTKGSERGERTHLSNMGITRETFFRSLGEAAHRMTLEAFETRVEALREQDRGAPGSLVGDPPAAFSLLRSHDEPKARWVDGTPVNTGFAFGLKLMFPELRFVHILRSPDDALRSMLNFHRLDKARWDAGAAAKEWRNQVWKARLVERAFGSRAVLRVWHRDLAENPQGMMRRICDFLGEEFDANCLLPLQQKINSSQVDEQDALPRELLRHELYKDGQRIFAELLEQDVPEDPDANAVQQLESIFSQLRLPES